MGERKGQNLYYPPDYDPRAGGLNKWQGTHALRERARKIHLGILIIRFEMPYNIWCDGCKNHIGMGVRYNAEKKKVGMYYSTPVYQFRMKCHLCDNHFEIKTDPQNLDYVIVSGARRQENRWDPTQNEQIVPETKETQRKLFDDAMYKLEHGAKDQKTADEAKPVLGRLFQRNDSVWRDDFEANSRLRAQFRTRKKELKLQEEKDNALLTKSSLAVALLPECDSDRRMAHLMRLHSSKTIHERDKERRSAILNRPALPSTSVNGRKVIGKSPDNIIKLERNSLGIVKRSTKGRKHVVSVANDAATTGSSNEQRAESQTVGDTSSPGSSLGSVAKTKETNQIDPMPSLLLCNYGSGSSDSD
ncbi:coiled-coil domain-containing protein 130 homolog [Anopheles bellator]|uniref:coiled-coil domain-containing protein 130 homolog n=1 Tax=Anopheles bellator TaxID=139047 RepID=UPI002648119D|nr:coiled-coil domain-containing protein 130 homolog [Anopheles bellator]